jgi:tetratricopeptide (TPR) repeat protein
MAAPSQSSPNQASKEEINASVTLKSAPPEGPVDATAPTESAVAAAATPDTNGATASSVESIPVPSGSITPAAGHEFTYESTEASSDYQLAKALMQNGDFDNAMETIGTAMAVLTSQLTDLAHATTNHHDNEDNEDNDDDVALHPALAPLYYLYGTTLLYTIEESTDELQGVEAQPGQEEDDDDANAASAVNATTADMADAAADDTQIAWENLEAARTILAHKMGPLSEKLQLDLAQIHLRLGDLQRANGRYQDAIMDYQQCFELRLPLLGPYDRKVADTQYNLGLVCMLVAAEGDRQQPPTAAAAAPNDDTTESDHPSILSPTVREEYRTRALSHYLGAAKAFAGQIAFLVGCNPDDILGNLTPIMPSGKTTGMEDADLAATVMSGTLHAIRARVATWTTNHSTNSTTTSADPPLDETGETIHELKEILDEIQETMDEAESSKQAIAEVSEIKLKAQAAADGEGGEVFNLDGSTTTIGFGTASAATATVMSSVAATTATAAAPPLMVVRKKVKRADDSDSNLAADKKPKLEEN